MFPIFPDNSTKVEDGKSFSMNLNSGPSRRYKVLSSGVVVADYRTGSFDYLISSVKTDLNIQIISEAVTYTVTATAGTGGTVTPSGSTTVEYGKDLILTPTVDPEYTMTAIKVNGVSVPVVKPYTLTNVTLNTDVKFEFTLTNSLILSNGADNKSRYWNLKSSERMDENHVHEYFINLNQDQLTWREYYYSNGKNETFSTTGVLVGNDTWSMLPGNIFIVGGGARRLTVIECSDTRFVCEQKAEFTQGRIEIVRDTYVRQ